MKHKQPSMIHTRTRLFRAGKLKGRRKLCTPERHIGPAAPLLVDANSPSAYVWAGLATCESCGSTVLDSRFRAVVS